MRIIAVIAFTLAASLAASAAIIADTDGTTSYVVTPPQRYLDAPYEWEIRVNSLPRIEVFEECFYGSGKPEQIGCARPWPKACDIYISNDLPEETHKIVLRHELAHCHGWPGNHPLD